MLATSCSAECRQSPADSSTSSRGASAAAVSLRAHYPPHHEQPRLRHFLDGASDALAAESRLLHTAVGHHVRSEARDVAGDDASDLQLIPDTEGVGQIMGEDPRLQAVAGRVRDLQRFLEVRERLQERLGPKASSSLPRLTSGTPSTTVASRTAPFRVPPQRTFAPCAFAAAIHPCSRTAAASSIIGPIGTSPSSLDSHSGASGPSPQIAPGVLRRYRPSCQDSLDRDTALTGVGKHSDGQAVDHKRQRFLLIRVAVQPHFLQLKDHLLGPRPAAKATSPPQPTR